MHWDVVKSSIRGKPSKYWVRALLINFEVKEIDIFPELHVALFKAESKNIKDLYVRCIGQDTWRRYIQPGERV
jgi:hypothetical protein